MRLIRITKVHLLGDAIKALWYVALVIMIAPQLAGAGGGEMVYCSHGHAAALGCYEAGSCASGINSYGQILALQAGGEAFACIPIGLPVRSKGTVRSATVYLRVTNMDPAHPVWFEMRLMNANEVLTPDLGPFVVGYTGDLEEFTVIFGQEEPGGEPPVPDKGLSMVVVLYNPPESAQIASITLCAACVSYK